MCTLIKMILEIVDCLELVPLNQSQVTLGSHQVILKLENFRRRLQDLFEERQHRQVKKQVSQLKVKLQEQQLLKEKQVLNIPQKEQRLHQLLQEELPVLLE